MVGLEDKRVWLTGASSGIGEALAHVLYEKGAKLILSARRRGELERVRARCGATEDRARILVLDLSRVDALGARTTEATSFFGGVDIMIHNGGVAHRDLVRSTELAVDRSVMDTNYFGAVAITKALLPSMMERGGGHFVVIGSLSGKYGVPRLSAYSASKHALQGFFESLRAEVAKDNIKITIVIPGIINTDIAAHALLGDGTVAGKPDPLHTRGMSARECAEKTVRAIVEEREEVLVGGRETLTVMFHRLFPGVFRRMIRSHPLKKWRRLTRRLVER